ncbi:MAG: response regulator [Proteobacteria bacterium]|nr:response regulator [Pseudomonadota bacterium]
MNPTTHSADLTGRSVLWLDDDPGLILLVQWALGRRGYDVIGYVDVATALEALAAAPDAFDVIVTDLSMPADGGIDTARQLMAIKPGVPVILSGSYIKPDVERRAFACGIRAVVEKTASVRELCAALERAMRAS